MKRLGAGVVLVVAVMFLCWRLFVHAAAPSAASKQRAHHETNAAGSSTADTSAAGHGPAGASTQSVVRLTPEDRIRVASQIRAAQRAHAAAAPPRLPAASAGSDDGAMATAKQVLTQLQKASDDIRGYVAECAKYAPDLKSFTAQITLIGDPDIGTLIDAPASAVGSNGEQVPDAFDNCIRGELQTLELPPMQTGDKFTVDFDIAL